MEIDLTSYVQYKSWYPFERDEDDKASSVGSVNQRLIGKRKRAEDDDDDGPKAKKMWQGFSPTDDEELRRKLRYLDEGPSRWGGLR